MARIDDDPVALGSADRTFWKLHQLEMAAAITGGLPARRALLPRGGDGAFPDRHHQRLSRLLQFRLVRDMPVL